MVKKLILLILATSICTQAVCLASDDEAMVEALVKRLGSSTFVERKKADTELRDCEKTIIQFLEKYKGSDDPEISLRIREIIKELETKPLRLKFEDDKLFRIMRKKAGTGLITDKDVPKISSLKADTAGIQSLKGLRYLTRISRLFLERNSITDISELKHLPNLSYVDLSSNDITDLTPLIENYKSRSNRGSFTVCLSGNPFKEEGLKQIETLRNLGVTVTYFEDTPLPDNMKPLCPSTNLVPYAGLDLLIKSDEQEQADAFFNEHRVLEMEVGTKMNGKVIPKDRLKHIWLHKTRSHNWKIYTSPGRTSKTVRPMKPGKYVYEFVVSSRKARFKCPPLAVTVAIPDDKKEIIEAFEKGGASSFLTNENGYRRADKPKDPEVNYTAVCSFLDKSPESFLNQVIFDKIKDIVGDDLYGRVKINPEDRKGLAAIAVRVNPDYIKETQKRLAGLKWSLKQMDQSDPFARGPRPETRKRRIGITEEWLKHAMTAEEEIKNSAAK